MNKFILEFKGLKYYGWPNFLVKKQAYLNCTGAWVHSKSIKKIDVWGNGASVVGKRK